MKLLKATEADISGIINIIKQAQAYFNEKGINQWQDNYPNLETVKSDVRNKNGYVLLKDNTVVGTVVVTFDADNNYKSIYNGEWITNNQYAVIHRLAIDSNFKGLGLSSLIINYIEKMSLKKRIKSIKIDTHKDNISMIKLLEKNGFKYCGIIYLEDKSKRIAFEKTLKTLEE